MRNLQFPVITNNTRCKHSNIQPNVLKLSASLPIQQRRALITYSSLTRAAQVGRSGLQIRSIMACMEMPSASPGGGQTVHVIARAYAVQHSADEFKLNLTIAPSGSSCCKFNMQDYRRLEISGILECQLLLCAGVIGKSLPFRQH